MASVDDVRKLASLARIALDEKELTEYAQGFDTIVQYVSKLQNAPLSSGVQAQTQDSNVFRADDRPYERGQFTDDIVAQFPKKDDDYLVVKKIISYD
jgi:aspartyl/glutamyl-tRNA(Asn/Gln) amidotransferase C subunit